MLNSKQTEHIDNPKGYGEGEDARRYHPNLRGPVDVRRLEYMHNSSTTNEMHSRASLKSILARV